MKLTDEQKEWIEGLTGVNVAVRMLVEVIDLMKDYDLDECEKYVPQLEEITDGMIADARKRFDLEDLEE